MKNQTRIISRYLAYFTGNRYLSRHSNRVLESIPQAKGLPHGSPSLSNLVTTQRGRQHSQGIVSEGRRFRGKEFGKNPIKHSIVISLIKRITEHSMSLQIKSQPRRGIARLNNIRTVTTPFQRCFLLKLVAESF